MTVLEKEKFYLDIIEITGSEPDTNRDYYLDELIPDISDNGSILPGQF